MRPQTGKKKLYSAAMQLFATQGYFATTVEQISAAAGVSKGLVYNYFDSKEELLIGLIEETTEKMESIAGTVSFDTTSGSFLSEFTDVFFTYLARHKAFIKLQLTLMLMPELQDIVGAAQKRRAKRLLTVVTRRLSESGVGQAKEKARLFVALLDGIALHYLFVYDRYPLAAMKSQIIDSVERLADA